MSSTTNPALPAFSYAQAARGRQSAAASSQKSTDVSATSSEKGARGRQSSSTDEQKAEARPKSPDAKARISSPSSMEPFDDQQPQNWAVHSELSESTNADLMKRYEAEQASKTTISPTMVSLSESEPSLDHKDGELSTGPNGGSDASEKPSETSMSIDKAIVSHEKDKSPVGESDGEDGSLPSNSQSKELKAAPAPPVNFWEQRRLAQDAKREQIAQRPPSSSGKPVVVSGLAADPTKTKTSQERDATSKRKPSEAAKTTGDKTAQFQATQGRPTSRDQSSAHASALPPPVGDAMAWPTPETAIEAEDRRKSSLDTNEKAEVKSTGTKQKKWTQVPFVPTAVFNTPLPPAAAKRGGRGGLRGGREGTGRGGHMSQNSIGGDKSEVVGSMGPPPLPRYTDQDRGRRPQPAQGVRATSVPPQERQTTSAAGPQTGSPKVSGSGPPPAGSVTIDEPASLKAQESRSSSRPTDMSSKEILNGNAEASVLTLASENDHAHPVADPVARPNILPDWYGNKPASSNSRPVDPGMRERGNQPRARNNYQESRDKVESWRDHAPPTDTTTRRDPRSERGARGSYRARGLNPSYVPASTHANTAPLPQQPFAPSKSQSYDTRQRQSSNYNPHGPSGSGRGVHRSQSIPTQQQMMSSGMPPLSPIQTDMQPYQYHGITTGIVYPGAYMSAVPQHPALDMYGLMSLVTAQLDYYFSIDNLCHDMYLRKHMDSQGFVSLRVIHGFKRMTTMTPDLELLRMAAFQSKVIEIRQADDGEDRVRRREGWGQWVLANMEDREQSARNAGPSAQAYQPRRATYGPMSAFAESPYGMGTPLRSPSWGVPGYNDISGAMTTGQPQQGMPNEHGMVEHANQLQTSGPGTNGDHNSSMHPAAQHGHLRSSSFISTANGTESHGIANGHAVTNQASELTSADQENVFPNERVSSVWVYARKGEDDGPSFASSAPRTFSQDSRGGMDASVGGLTSPTFASGLRGGAASPEQIQRLHSRDQPPFADSSRQNGTFFLKDGVSQSDFDREGSDPWPYHMLHAKALEQRDQGLHGTNNHEMEILYQFWPTFLFQNFNAGMYKDFYRFALEDLTHGSTNGSKHLAKYYGYQLAADKPLSDQAAQDIVAAIRQENGESKPIFQKVRSFWRDGAFNMKSRKRINDLLDAAVREELAK